MQQIKKCGDKGISVGEKSKMLVSKIEVNDSEIGIASKDSSLTKLKEAKFKNAKTCLAAYNKKKNLWWNNWDWKCELENYVKRVDFDKSSIIKEVVRVSRNDKIGKKYVKIMIMKD